MACASGPRRLLYARQGRREINTEATRRRQLIGPLNQRDPNHSQTHESVGALHLFVGAAKPAKSRFYTNRNMIHQSGSKANQGGRCQSWLRTSSRRPCENSGPIKNHNDELQDSHDLGLHFEPFPLFLTYPLTGGLIADEDFRPKVHLTRLSRTCEKRRASSIPDRCICVQLSSNSEKCFGSHFTL